MILKSLSNTFNLARLLYNTVLLFQNDSQFFLQLINPKIIPVPNRCLVLIHGCLHVDVHLNVCACMSVCCVSTHTCINAYLCVYIYACAHLCKYMCVGACVCVCIHAHTSVSVYISVHRCVHYGWAIV